VTAAQPSPGLPAPTTAPSMGLSAARPKPWPLRRILPILGVVGLIAIGMAGTIWGPLYWGNSAWAVPDDLWASLVAAQRFGHLDLAGLYTSPTNLVSFPGTAVILVPLAAVIDLAGLPIHAGRQGAHPTEWLLGAPGTVILSSVVLFAADAIAERLRIGALKRFLLAAASATALWNVTIRWGHPEDAIAIGLLLYAILALSGSRTARAAWLIGAAVSVQPLVLLAFPVLAAAVEPRRLPGFAVRAAIPSAVLLGAAAAANWSATVHAVTSQPNSPTIDHPTPWVYLAPHLSDGSVAAGPARALTLVLACGCGLVTWRRWRAARETIVWSPDDVTQLLWWTAAALTLRSVFEPVMVSYYVWPPLAVALVAASRSWWRLIPTTATAITLTFLSQVSWRNPWIWWTPMVTLLGLTLLFSYPWPARSAATRVLPEAINAG
jgi:hypothetical protein